MGRSRSRTPAAPPDRTCSVARSFAVIELLSDVPQGLSIREIAERLGVPLSTTHGIVKTMLSLDYLARSSDWLVRLGPKLVQIAAKVASESSLLAAARSVMDHVAALCGETINLVVLEGSDVVIVQQAVGSGPLRVTHALGVRCSAHSAASGKAILSLLSDEELDQLYPMSDLLALTPNTVTDKSVLKRELVVARESLVASSCQESDLGVSTVGSAIRDSLGRPVAGLSIDCLTANWSDTAERKLAALVKTAALLVSQHMGYTEAKTTHRLDIQTLAEVWKSA
jgi:IclR family KDG regulon transcriptional repressor